MKKYLTFTLLLCLPWCFSFTNADKLSAIPLLDLKGKKVYLNQINKHKATVLIYVSPECPLCQSYSLTINNLIETYAPKQVAFYGIVPGLDYDVADILKYQRTYKSRLPLYRDTEKKTVQLIGATITPEVFVLNQAGALVYAGRIDNWAYELGKKRKVITEHNLRDALVSVLANRPVLVKKTKAVGCFIE